MHQIPGVIEKVNRGICINNIDIGVEQRSTRETKMIILYFGCRKKAILPIHQIPWVITLVKEIWESSG